MSVAPSLVKGTVSTAGRRLGREAAKMAMQEPHALSRISESGESVASSRVSPPPEKVASATGVTFVQQAKTTCRNALDSKLAVTTGVFLITFVLLCALNPPMAQTPTDDASKPRERSWKKITAWSSLTAALALVLPFCFVKTPQ